MLNRISKWVKRHRVWTGVFVLVFLFGYLPGSRSGDFVDFLRRTLVFVVIYGFFVFLIHVRDRRDAELGEKSGSLTPPRNSDERQRAAAILAGTLVETYRNQDEFQRRAAILVLDHWSVLNVVERKPNAGCLRIALLWWFTLLFPPRPQLMVTYKYNDPSKATSEPTPGVDFRATGQSANKEAVTQRACFNCGAVIAITHKFCPECGAPLGPRVNPESSQRVEVIDPALPATSNIIDVDAVDQIGETKPG